MRNQYAGRAKAMSVLPFAKKIACRTASTPAARSRISPLILSTLRAVALEVGVLLV